MNLNKLDRIILRNKEEVDRLMTWRDSNKELVRHFKPVMREGLIVSFNGISYYFKQQGDFIIRYVVFHNERAIMKLHILRLSNGKYRVLSDWFSDSVAVKDREQNTMSVVTIHFTLMAYMQNYVEYVSERKQLATINNNNKTKKRKKNNVRKIGRKVYNVSIPHDISQIKRTYNKSDNPFPVRGHLRRYKSGKVIWIESYTKGDITKDREPKNYHL